MKRQEGRRASMTGKIKLEIKFVSGTKDSVVVDSSSGWWYQDGYLFIVVPDGAGDIIKHYELANVEYVRKSVEVKP